MNEFTVNAPDPGFSGESCGVVFTDGAGRVNDSSKEGRAAIEYFRRRGYTLTPEGAEDEPPTNTNADVQTGGPDEDDYVVPDGPFDPSEHSVEEVLAYLDHVDRDVADRVIAAERDGKARKTILQKGADQ